MIKQWFPLEEKKLAEALAVHLRRLLRGYRSEIKRRIVARKGDLFVFYEMDDKPLKDYVSERVAGFTVGWHVCPTRDQMGVANGFKPAVYQDAIFRFVTDSSPRRPHRIVNAVAGAGKTTTLEHAARLIDTPGLFCAFNKHIAQTLGTQTTVCE